jgi:hypothetical protein
MERACDEKYGIEGEWFIEGSGWAGQDRDETIVDYNRPPCTQPSLWLQWLPNEEGTQLEWNGQAKTYNTENWIVYLIERFFRPLGYTLNGIIEAQGEERSDKWGIQVINNTVRAINAKGKVTKEDWNQAKIRQLLEASPEELVKLVDSNPIAVALLKGDWKANPFTESSNA